MKKAASITTLLLLISLLGSFSASKAQGTFAENPLISARTHFSALKVGENPEYHLKEMRGKLALAGKGIEAIPTTEKELKALLKRGYRVTAEINLARLRRGGSLVPEVDASKVVSYAKKAGLKLSELRTDEDALERYVGFNLALRAQWKLTNYRSILDGNAVAYESVQKDIYSARAIYAKYDDFAARLQLTSLSALEQRLEAAHRPH